MVSLTQQKILLLINKKISKSHEENQVLLHSFHPKNPVRTCSSLYPIQKKVKKNTIHFSSASKVQSRAEFLELIRTHPVFVSARACGMLGLYLGRRKRESHGIFRNILGYMEISYGANPKWIVSFVENPFVKWMIRLGVPLFFRKPSYFMIWGYNPQI